MTSQQKTTAIELAKAIAIVLAACASLIALIIASSVQDDVGLLPESYSVVHHEAYAELVEERISNLSTQIEALAVLVTAHAKLEMHSGAALAFARLERDMAHLLDGFQKMDARLKELAEQIKDGG